MKVAFVFILVLFQDFLLAQDHQPIINSKYTFSYMSGQYIPDLMPGNYLLRTDADYFNILNPDVFHPSQMPVTSLYNDFGMVLKRDHGALVIDSIVETKYHVIIYTKIITSNYSFGSMNDCAVFIRLRKTRKEIFVSETPVEEVVEDKPDVVRIKLN
ncbi:MAG: hypothetical protein V4677_09015 [Bacteroidota bacterium]